MLVMVFDGKFHRTHETGLLGFKKLKDTRLLVLDKFQTISPIWRVQINTGINAYSW